MRKFALNKIPSVESAEVQVPAQEISELPVSVEPIDGDSEVTEYSEGCDELCNTVTALESLICSMESSLTRGGLDRQAFEFAQMHAKHLTNSIGLDDSIPSMESAGSRLAATEIALESVKETLGKAVTAVLEFLGRLWEAAVKFVTGMTKHARDLKKKFLELKGKEFDYDAEVISKVGNKGKLFCKNGKPNPSAIKDAEAFVASFYSSKYSSTMVDLKLIGKLFIGVGITGEDVVKAMVNNFPMFLGDTPPSNATRYGGVSEFVWQSPIESFSIRAVVPNKNEFLELMNSGQYVKCGYYPTFDLDTRGCSGSLKDLGITNVDALIPRLTAAVEEFEKKSNQWESAVTRNKAAQAMIRGQIRPEAQSYVAKTLSPLGRSIVEPMRSMANVSYQMLYALEAMFRAATSSEKEVKTAK